MPILHHTAPADQTEQPRPACHRGPVQRHQAQLAARQRLQVGPCWQQLRRGSCPCCSSCCHATRAPSACNPSPAATPALARSDRFLLKSSMSMCFQAENMSSGNKVLLPLATLSLAFSSLLMRAQAAPVSPALIRALRSASSLRACSACWTKMTHVLAVGWSGRQVG